MRLDIANHDPIIEVTGLTFLVGAPGSGRTSFALQIREAAWEAGIETRFEPGFPERAAALSSVAAFAERRANSLAARDPGHFLLILGEGGRMDTTRNEQIERDLLTLATRGHLVNVHAVVVTSRPVPVPEELARRYAFPAHRLA